MTISELTKALDGVRAIHGDLPVYVNGEPILYELPASEAVVMGAEDPEEMDEYEQPYPRRVYIRPLYPETKLKS